MNPESPSRKRAIIFSGGGARGAYEVGVWRFLEEIGWKADLATGTSVGSINAALVSMGWTAADIENYWLSLRRRKVYHYPIWKSIKSSFSSLTGGSRRPPSIFDSKPLHNQLLKIIDLERLHNEETELVITATDVERAQVHYFVGEEITVKHILASCSIPVFFPWQEIDGKTYWDGGIMANTPILPAIQRNAKEIIIVLLSPLFEDKVPLPRNHKEAAAWTMDLSAIGSLNALGRYFAHQFNLDLDETLRSISENNFVQINDVRVGIVAPESAYSLSSILDFKRKKMKASIERGYDDARAQLKGFLTHTKTPVREVP